MSPVNQFPQSHLLLAALVALSLTSYLLASPDAQEEDRFTTELVLERLQPSLAEPAKDVVPSGPPTRTRTETVRAGDSLATIFKRLGIPARELHEVLESGATAQRLKRIHPGRQLTFLTFEDAAAGEPKLLSLSYATGALERLVFERENGVFTAHHIERQPDRVKAYKTNTIESSLFLSSQEIGLNDDIAVRLAQIFQWDIDFVLDIRQGDQFHLLFEELYLDEEFIGFGDILAAEFVNQGEAYRAIRYTDPNGRADYFAPDGRSMRKAFLRAPVHFSRISSNFNLRRLHPLRKRVMPHRGIDYAAPAGTPILAAGDGKVVSATRNSASGNFVVIQHGEQFQTKYLHLSKFGRGIRSGKRVEQGQVIGYVGSTGWATGPHLHYEFLVNGIYKNPRTVALPEAKPIRAKERSRFESQAEPLLALLDNYKQQVELAVR
jgi:murein DD-endopeptidase MepM/ murein hydrolase activator NlpD